jgi:hypothetical protein
MDDFAVVAGAGSLRSTAAGAVEFPHRWTAEGVTVEAAFTGAHLLHLAAAGCVLNDVYREAEKVGYTVEIDTPAPAAAVDELMAIVDEVAEIPRSIRAGASVERIR